jgi:hypothetical protein
LSPCESLITFEAAEQENIHCHWLKQEQKLQPRFVLRLKLRIKPSPPAPLSNVVTHELFSFPNFGNFISSASEATFSALECHEIFI